MSIAVRSLADWSDEQIAIIGHNLCDLTHLLRQQEPSANIQNAIDFLHLSDDVPNSLHLQVNPHIHSDFVELIYIKFGSGMTVIGDQEYMIHKGDLLVVNPLQLHNNIPLPQLAVTNCLVSVALLCNANSLFRPCITHNGTLCLPPLIHLTGNTLLRVEQLLEDMSAEINHKQPYYQDAVQNKFNELLILLRRFEETITTNDLTGALSAAIAYIREHYDTVTLAEAAAISHYNPTYFSRLFFKCTKQHFTEYVNKLRINKALLLLMSTDSAVEEISVAVGFKSKIHFYDVFRQYTGMTPGSIRKSQKGGAS